MANAGRPRSTLRLVAQGEWPLTRKGRHETCPYGRGIRDAGDGFRVGGGNDGSIVHGERYGR